MFRFWTLIFLLIIPGFVRAQEYAADTVRLKDVIIYGLPVHQFSDGYKIITFDSSKMEMYRHLSVGEFLSRKTPLFFRSYGNGMTSTISFRGTGPSHTAVLWNGLNINQPSIGQTDFSILPLLAADRLMVQYGPSGSFYGSDALGGSILLSTLPGWNEKTGFDITQEFTNYGQTLSALRFESGTENAGLKTRLYFNNNPNHFSYKNITREGQPVERQQNASAREKGLIQDLFFKPGKHQQVKLSGWYNESRRQLQPVISDPDNSDKLYEKNVRVSGDYSYSNSLLTAGIKAGYLGDVYLFNGNNRTLSDQYILQGEVNRNFGPLYVMAGGKIDYLTARSDNYIINIKENRSDIFTGLKWDIHSRINFSLVARKQWVSNFYSPVAPSFGTDIILIQKPKTDIHWSFQASRSFRIPTFNDRYWEPGGNPSLKPENGSNIETGLSAKSIINGYRFGFNSNIYHMKVNDWIQWVPAGNYWSPRNVRVVQCYGAEFSVDAEKTYSVITATLNLRYSYNRAIDKSNSSSSVTYGKQLAYTPVNNIRASLIVSFSSWIFNSDYSYTGKRYVTADEQDNLPAFQILNIAFGRNFSLFGGRFSCFIRVNNLTNTSYQVMSLRAMPLRNYGLSINYSFH